MNRIALLALFAATAVQAQEIGSEIPPPVTPNSNVNAPYDNPYGPNPNTAKQGEPPPTPPLAPGITGPQVSAHSGSFGFTAAVGFGGTTTVGLPSASFGMAFFVSDIIKLTIDAGMQSTFGSSKSPFGFALAVGIQPTFRSPAASARPFLVVEAGFGKSFTTVSDDFALIGNLGGGGEYFFSPFFSMNIRAVASFILNLKNSDFSMFVITPGVGATVYF